MMIANSKNGPSLKEISTQFHVKEKSLIKKMNKNLKDMTNFSKSNNKIYHLIR